MSTVLTILVGALMAMLVMVPMWRIEQRRGQRVIAVRPREGLDILLARVERLLQTSALVWQRYVWQLGWRYVIHIVLRSLLVGIANLYNGLLTYFEYNRRATKYLKRDKRRWLQSGLWYELDKHKQAAALTEEEKIQRKAKALAGD